MQVSLRARSCSPPLTENMQRTGKFNHLEEPPSLFLSLPTLSPPHLSLFLSPGVGWVEGRCVEDIFIILFTLLELYLLVPSVIAVMSRY